MPIRFIDAHGHHGTAAIVLGDLIGAMTGDVAEPIIFAGSIAQRLDDLSGQLIGDYELISARSGPLTATLAGTSGLLTGSSFINPLLPPASVGLELL